MRPFQKSCFFSFFCCFVRLVLGCRMTSFAGFYHKVTCNMVILWWSVRLCHFLFCRLCRFFARRLCGFLLSSGMLPPNFSSTWLVCVHVDRAGSQNVCVGVLVRSCSAALNCKFPYNVTLVHAHNGCAASDKICVGVLVHMFSAEFYL